MQGADFLLTIAEISLALVGFSAVIVAFRQAGGRTWSQFERLLIRGMIELGFAALFFALVPHILVYLHFPDPWVWGLSSTSFARLRATPGQAALSCRGADSRGWRTDEKRLLHPPEGPGDIRPERGNRPGHL